jgi:hypothetical protein
MTADSLHLTDLNLFELLDDTDISFESLEKYRTRKNLVEHRQTELVKLLEASDVDSKSLFYFNLRIRPQINPINHCIYLFIHQTVYIPSCNQKVRGALPPLLVKMCIYENTIVLGLDQIQLRHPHSSLIMRGCFSDVFLLFLNKSYHLFFLSKPLRIKNQVI